MRGSQCVCVSTEYKWDTVSVSCVCMRWSLLRHRQCLPHSSHILLWHLHLLSPCCAAKTYAPCVYVCECVCVSATVHLCIFLSCISARERFLCHCANYTKTTTTTTSGRTDNVCHHMQHSARRNPPLPPLLPSPFHRSTALDTHTQHLCIYFCAEIVICMSWRWKWAWQGGAEAVGGQLWAWHLLQSDSERRPHCTLSIIN